MSSYNFKVIWRTETINGELNPKYDDSQSSDRIVVEMRLCLKENRCYKERGVRASRGSPSTGRAALASKAHLCPWPKPTGRLRAQRAVRHSRSSPHAWTGGEGSVGSWACAPCSDTNKDVTGLPQSL